MSSQTPPPAKPPSLANASRVTPLVGRVLLRTHHTFLERVSERAEDDAEQAPRP